jgi:hypothetical protein
MFTKNSMEKFKKLDITPTRNSEESHVYTEQALESIDENQLVDFLVEQLRPMGFDEETLRARFLSTTFLSTKDEHLAGANGKKIVFNPESFVETIQTIVKGIEHNQGMSFPENDIERIYFDVAKMVALSTFIHEQLHHLTFSSFEHRIDPHSNAVDGFEHTFTRKGGVEMQLVKEKKVLTSQQSEFKDGGETVIENETKLFFRGLNEGLTELLAQELATEYMRQNPTIEDTELASAFIANEIENGAYTQERFKVEQLAVVLAEMAEVPKDIMLKSFFHEYVNNGHLLPPEFKQVLVEYAPEGVTDDQIEEGIAAFCRSLITDSFDAESQVNNRLAALIKLMPKEKADRCTDILAEVYKKYHPSQLL